MKGRREEGRAKEWRSEDGRREEGRANEWRSEDGRSEEGRSKEGRAEQGLRSERAEQERREGNGEATVGMNKQRARRKEPERVKGGANELCSVGRGMAHGAGKSDGNKDCGLHSRLHVGDHGADGCRVVLDEAQRALLRRRLEHL